MAASSAGVAPDNLQSALNTARRGPLQAVIRQFTQMLPRPDPAQDINRPTALGPRLADFFQVALALTERAPEVQYKTIERLASEQGLQNIKELIGEISTRRNFQARFRLWISCLRPLFLIISNTTATSSESLQGPLEAIYNLFADHSGSLKLLCEFVYHLTTSMSQNPSSVKEDLVEILLLFSQVLPKLAPLSASTSPEATCKLIEQFLALPQQIGISISLEGLDLAVRETKSQFERLGGREAAAGAIDQGDEADGPSLFILEKDQPGSLRSRGPRHDNDFEDIARIRILPTTAEICSSEREYIPTYDSSNWHLPGFLGLIDRHFRLFREDNVAALRDAVRPHLEGRSPTASITEAHQLPTNIYNVIGVNVEFEAREGFAIRLSIEQPSEVANRNTAAHREKWWVDSQRLDWDRLVCLVGKGYAMFCQVSRSTCRRASNLMEKRRKGKPKYYKDATLFNSREVAYLTLYPADLKSSDIDFMQTVFNSTKAGLKLVEFSSVLLQSFQPILSTLQTMSRCQPREVPLSEFLVSRTDQGQTEQSQYHIPPPSYAMPTSRNAFRFDLKVLMKNGGRLRYSPQEHPAEPIAQLSRESKLDEGQATALINTLRRRLALIQGPPGTGKSFTGEAIIEVLLANKLQTRLGPIICACQTNHALDQLLEHLYLRKGIHRMIRIGASSKSATISNLTLHTMMEGIAPPRPLREARQSRDKLAKAISRVLDQAYEARYMSAHAVAEIHNLSEQYARSMKSCDAAWARYNAAFLLQEADIIGVTTTGLSRYRDILCLVGSKVVVCEEAGEVLEAHMLAALMPAVEHLILIGDHQQLRPHCNNWEFQVFNPLGRPYALDLSLYERLVQPLRVDEKKVPFDTLTIQRRMHPTIANLVRSTIYPNLRDAENVKEYPELAGFKRRLFWFHHEVPENSSGRSSANQFSYTNRHEISIVKDLLGYLNRQAAYGDGQIAVITPYAGQLRELKIHLGTAYNVTMNEQDAEEQERYNLSVNLQEHRNRKLIRVATVDNFQGEEGEVVIVSLVRSNSSGRCGFLSESNRANVLLSRAKHGMIIIGNADTYSHCEMWWKIIEIMHRDQNVGTSFEIPCPRHKQETALISTTRDFLNPKCQICSQAGFSAPEPKNPAPSRAPIPDSEPTLSVSRPSAITQRAPGREKKPAESLKTAQACTHGGHGHGHGPLSKWERCTRRCARTLPCGHQCPSPCGEICPGVMFCQICATEDVKTKVVDRIGLRQYQMMDLNEDPCILPTCLHMVATSTLDAQLGMDRHYEVTQSSQARERSFPPLFSQTIPTGCPVCGGSLRNIARYGRIFHQLEIEDTLKVFIGLSHKKLVALELELLDEQETLENQEPSPKFLRSAEALGRLEISGPPLEMIRAVYDWAGSRYDSIVALMKRINNDLDRIRTEESQVYRALLPLKKCQEKGSLNDDEDAGISEIQLQSKLSLTILLIRCDVAIVADCFSLRRKANMDGSLVSIDLSGLMRLCEHIIILAQEAHYPRHEIEARILVAKMIAITLDVAGTSPGGGGSGAADQQKALAFDYLERALDTAISHPCLSYLVEDVGAVHGLFGSTFRNIVSVEEKRGVWEEYSSEFDEKHNWYLCANYHPFSSGGEPNQPGLLCPECSAPARGQKLVEPDSYHGGDQFSIDSKGEETPAYEALSPM